MSFVLHPRLAAGAVELDRRGGCLVLLKNNALFPWILVVPEVDGAIEDLHQLEPARFDEVMRVVRDASGFVAEQFRPLKLNVACIGNQVRQMHLHIVGRSEHDPAWPGVVWSFEGKQPYTADEIAAIAAAWKRWITGAAAGR